MVNKKRLALVIGGMSLFGSSLPVADSLYILPEPEKPAIIKEVEEAKKTLTTLEDAQTILSKRSLETIDLSPVIETARQEAERLQGEAEVPVRDYNNANNKYFTRITCAGLHFLAQAIAGVGIACAGMFRILSDKKKYR